MPDIEVSTTINASVEKVWECLIDIESWRHWWPGHKLQKVDPAWQEGGKLVWKTGRPSTINSFTSPTYFQWMDMNMGIEIYRSFRLEVVDQGSTKIIHDLKIIGASFPPGGEAQERNDMVATLSKIRNLAEKGQTKWWEFWK